MCIYIYIYIYIYIIGHTWPYRSFIGYINQRLSNLGARSVGQDWTNVGHNTLSKFVGTCCNADGKLLAIFLIFLTTLIDYRLTDEYERPIMIDAVIEEGLTTRRQNASVQITLHKHKYTMELIKTSEYFKPGLKYTAFVSMSHASTFSKWIST